MRILVGGTYYYVRGGAERCLISLAQLLEAHGHEVIPFSMHHEQNLPTPYDRFFVSNIDFPTALHADAGIRGKLQVAERVIYSREAKRKMTELIDAVRPDVVHLHNIAHELSPSILPPIREAKIPVVQTLHDYKLLCPNTSFISNGAVCERCKGHRYYNAVRYRCKRDSLGASLLAAAEVYVHNVLGLYERNIDAFIAPSRFLQEKAAQFGVKTPVVQIPNFIEVDRFEPCYEADDYFVFVGRLVEIKGIFTLLDAMRGVRTSHLYIAGGGEDEAGAREFARKEGLDNVTFLGHLSGEQLRPLVQRARFAVVPSQWYENYPMSVLEAFACGTPVIGADIGGIPELVQENETGLLFPPGDAVMLREKICYLLANSAKAAAMGRAGRCHVEKHNSPSRHYAQTMELYARLRGQRATAVV